MIQRGQSYYRSLTANVTETFSFTNGAEIVSIRGGSAYAWFGDKDAMTPADIIAHGVPFSDKEKLDNFPHREYDIIHFATDETGVEVHYVERRS